MFTKKKIGTSENGTKRNESSKGPDLGLLFFFFSKLFISYNLFKSANNYILINLLMKESC